MEKIKHRYEKYASKFFPIGTRVKRVWATRELAQAYSKELAQAYWEPTQTVLGYRLCVSTRRCGDCKSRSVVFLANNGVHCLHNSEQHWEKAG